MTNDTEMTLKPLQRRESKILEAGDPCLIGENSYFWEISIRDRLSKGAADLVWKTNSNQTRL